MHIFCHLLTRSAVLFFGLAIVTQLTPAFAQIDLTWLAAGDGSTFSDDANWIPSAGVGGPELTFDDDSLKFNSAGTTITNDLDPADNDGVPILLNHGSGTSGDSGSFHFLNGAGNFTFDGFPVLVGLGNSATSSFVRADTGAGLTQTFNMPIQLTGSGNRSRAIAMNNSIVGEDGVPTTYAEAIFNGDIDYVNDRLLIWESASRVVLNGNNSGSGIASFTPAGTTNIGRTTIRVNDDAFASEIVLGTDTALAGGTTGTWANGDLVMIGGIQTVAAAYLTTNAPLDLSDNFLQLDSGVGAVEGSINYRSDFDSSIGYVIGANGNRRLKVSGSGALTIENGVFAGTYDTGRVLLLFADGAGGTDGEIVINGALHNTFIDPISWVANGTAAGGGILTPRNDIDSVITGMDTNAAIRAESGTFRLNGDSSTSWISSLYRSMANSTTYVGNDNAFGDANSLVTVESNGIIDIGSHSVQQRFVITEGTIRGTGSLTNEADWNITGTIQPGSETQTTADALTFDFSAAAGANSLQFESSSTINFVLDASFESSMLSVFGASAGTNVVLNDNTLFLTDISGGSLSAGSYTLIDGDLNTTYTLGSSITVDGLSGFTGSVSVSGDDLVLNLAAAVGTPGDFNQDGVVDAADYTVYRDNLGLATTLPNDAGLGSPVSAAHYTLWVSFYGQGDSSAAAAAVPEPSSMVLFAAGATLCGLISRRK